MTENLKKLFADKGLPFTFGVTRQMVFVSWQTALLPLPELSITLFEAIGVPHSTTPLDGGLRHLRAPRSLSA